RPFIVQLAQCVTTAIIMYAAIQIAFYMGIEEKSWFQRSWEILVGGSVGLITGAVFFGLVGAIGWVSGPLFGALGLIGLATGGAFGGMGLGAVINVIRDPSQYEISFGIVTIVIVLGAMIAAWLARFVGRRLSSSVTRQ
ncbi:hypothetical protein RZS08_11460, partial [Arthrospira platensis SPKY1]|nr:hypothetical protein [Arthrospira platensis SPKY1]